MRSMKLNLIASVLKRRQYSTKVGIVGVPFNYGSTYKNLGVERGPSAIRAGNLIENILEFHENVDVKDFGDIEIYEPPAAASDSKTPENMHFYDRLMPTMQRLSEKIGEIRRDDRICVTLGGDHAIGVGRFLE